MVVGDLGDLGDSLFAIMIDESRDISVKEQMVVALRYVNKKGQVIERFLGMVHVSDTSASSLKLALESLLAKHKLSLSRIRGQGYDGASNMRGEYNGLKSLILKENCSAFYIHCFAHQLQLALVALAKKHSEIASFFNQVATLSNVVGASAKRRDILRESQIEKVDEALKEGEISSGRGLNQEATIKRAGDTRWSSHFGTLLSIVSLFSSMIDVLDVIEEDGTSLTIKGDAMLLLKYMQSFEFVFILHLMKKVLSITHELSQALQRSDQDIVNAMKLVKVSKQKLQTIRDKGWDSLLNEVSLFCDHHEVVMLNMDDTYQTYKKSKRNLEKVSNLHYFQVQLFYQVIDRQLQELNNRFTEVSTELLLCVSCLSPRDSFSAFDKEKLLRLAQFYPSEFSPIQILALDSQLENYFIDVWSEDAFSELEGISDLSLKLVETRKHIVYPLVYLLLELSLILPVATTTAERAFSAMKIIKNELRNRMGDSWSNDCLVTYIEKDVFIEVENEKIIQSFQKMASRREHL
ncbi:zinc finger MYM-type protein 1-like [Trifolium pratense]|uniref:zinc finger MYM-type protein 1-like n=1 Tax=Trifolium pratense TaxID=57577 RepID=UPI001E693626|nr:zinc finger MYM-type protein 1-like [Trifolium pratense]